MYIQFLGTSSGTPTKSRNVSAIAICESQGADWYLVDCGEATQHQILSTPLSLKSLAGIMITHIHGDHCYGLPGLLASAGMSGRHRPLTIIAPVGIQPWLQATLEHTQLYLPYEVNFVSVENMPIQHFGQFSVSSIELSHRVPSFAYCFTEAQVKSSLDIEKLEQAGITRGPLWGQLQAGKRIEHNGQHFEASDFLMPSANPRQVIVCGDNDTPAKLQSYCSDCSVLIHESTYTQDMAEKAASAGHSCVNQIAEFAQQQEIANLLLTHFSPRYQDGGDTTPSISSMESEARSIYTGNLFMASDFDRYHLLADGVLEPVI